MGRLCGDVVTRVPPAKPSPPRTTNARAARFFRRVMYEFQYEFQSINQSTNLLVLLDLLCNTQAPVLSALILCTAVLVCCLFAF